MLKNPNTPSILLISYIIILSVCVIVGPAKFSTFFFPLSSLLIAIFLHRKSPHLYLCLTICLVFFGPLIRRYIDYKAGYFTFGPWVFTPLLVTSVSSITFFKNLPKTWRKAETLGFLLCMWPTLYYLAVSLLSTPGLKTVNGLFTWLCPIALGYYLFSNWRDYPNYSKLIQTLFTWGALIMGFYGIFQYLTAPPWDAFYLENTDADSFGEPEPLKIRVFGTQSSPQSFATVIMAALLVASANLANPISFPANVLGSISLLLSMARAVWLGWLIGIPLLFGSLKLKFQFRFILAGIVIVFASIWLILSYGFVDVITERFDSFSDSKGDVSYNARTEGYAQLGEVLSNAFVPGFIPPLPNSISIALGDSTIIPMVLSFGWIGTVPYLVGMFLLVLRIYTSKVTSKDTLHPATRSIILAILSQFFLNNMVTDIIGVIFWCFIGMGLAHEKYYHSHSMKEHIQE
jgi:hypothetical protein